MMFLFKTWEMWRLASVGVFLLFLLLLADVCFVKKKCRVKIKKNPH
jgi:hypothetical protein